MIADVSKFEKEYLLSMISPENKDVIEIGCGYGEQLQLNHIMQLMLIPKR